MHTVSRYPRVASSICLCLLIGSCGGDGPTQPDPGQPRVRVLLGANVTDTIETQPLQPLVVEVRLPYGVLARGAVVRFEPQPPAEPRGPFEAAVFVCPLAAQTCGAFGGGQQFVIDTTDSQGRAKVTVRLGSAAGRAVVKLSVPEFGLEDSATYTVTPGAAAGVRAAPRDTAIDIGGTATLHGYVIDRYGNARTEATTVTSGPGTVITLNAATATVTGLDMGTQSVATHFGSFIDSTSVRVVPPGRLVVWSNTQRVIRLVDTNGGNERTLVSNVSSELGAFPRFDPSRNRVTLHNGAGHFASPSNNIIVADTTGVSQRDISPAVGFSVIMATREMADGTILVVARRGGDTSHPGFSLWRVATDNTVTFVIALPQLEYQYGAADISHNGTRVAYIATDPSTFIDELRVFTVANGATVRLESNARSPRWSFQGDRIAYLIPLGAVNRYEGTAVVVNADGTGRRVLGTRAFSAGLTWSPNGLYIVGRSNFVRGMWLIRISDLADVLLRFPSPSGCCQDNHDYFEPDWR